MTLTTRRHVRLALATALVGLLTLGFVPAADAATWTHRDARGDVFDVSMGEGMPTRNRTDKATDITRFSVRHSRRQVSMTVNLRELRGGSSTLMGRLLTPKGDFMVMAMRSPDMRMFMLMDAKSLDEEPDAGNCRGKRLRYEAKRHRIRITIPRTCLDSPAWVRAGAAYFRGDMLAAFEDEATMSYDDALRKGSGRAAMAGNPKMGPRVRVG